MTPAAGVQPVIVGAQLVESRFLPVRLPEGENDQWKDSHQTEGEPEGVLRTEDPQRQHHHAPDEEPHRCQLHAEAKSEQPLQVTCK